MTRLPAFIIIGVFGLTVFAMSQGKIDGAAGVLAMLFVFVYMIPTFVACSRAHNNALAIAVLNVLAGWSVIGWIGALVWSCTSNVARVQQ